MTGQTTARHAATRRLGAFAATALMVPALASCSSLFGGGIDMDKLTAGITDSFNETLKPMGHSVDDVQCDDPGKKPADGTEFKCTATSGDTTFNVVATVDGDDVKFQGVELAFDMKMAAEKLTPIVSKEVKADVNIDCGTGLKAYAPGQTFQCTVRDDAGNSRPLTYTVSEGGKNDRWELT